MLGNLVPDAVLVRGHKHLLAGCKLQVRRHERREQVQVLLRHLVHVHLNRLRGRQQLELFSARLDGFGALQFVRHQREGIGLV